MPLKASGWIHHLRPLPILAVWSVVVEGGRLAQAEERRKSSRLTKWSLENSCGFQFGMALVDRLVPLSRDFVARAYRTSSHTEPYHRASPQVLLLGEP